MTAKPQSHQEKTAYWLSKVYEDYKNFQLVPLTLLLGNEEFIIIALQQNLKVLEQFSQFTYGDRVFDFCKPTIYEFIDHHPELVTPEIAHTLHKLDPKRPIRKEAYEEKTFIQLITETFNKESNFSAYCFSDCLKIIGQAPIEVIRANFRNLIIEKPMYSRIIIPHSDPFDDIDSELAGTLNRLEKEKHRIRKIVFTPDIAFKFSQQLSNLSYISAIPTELITKELLIEVFNNMLNHKNQGDHKQHNSTHDESYYFPKHLRTVEVARYILDINTDFYKVIPHCLYFSYTFNHLMNNKVDYKYLLNKRLTKAPLTIDEFAQITLAIVTNNDLTNVNELNHCFMTGALFNKLTPTTEFFKLTSKSEKTTFTKIQDGTVEIKIDPHKLTSEPQPATAFVTKQQIGSYYTDPTYCTWMRNVTIPDDAYVFIDTSNFWTNKLFCDERSQTPPNILSIINSTQNKNNEYSSFGKELSVEEVEAIKNAEMLEDQALMANFSESNPI